ncbi:MAG TPA: serine/threonine protein phosphatase [Bacillales bacterium]|nr:serine/threonine protein phosphatase [Bacillales bacterium]
MRKENSIFKTGFITEAGSFVQNKEYFAFTELDDIACWVVVQGLDLDKGVHSAELAAKGILEKFMENPSMSRAKLKQYIKNAHVLLQEQSLRVRLKASIVVVISDYTKMMWAVAGHARLYHFRNGRLFFKSKDQSLSQELANEVRIPENFDHHEERHNLLFYIGKPSKFQPLISKKTKLMDGDVLLLCSSGLWEEVSVVEMTDALAEVADPNQYVDLLEEILLSRQKRIVKPYTMAAIFSDKIYQENKKNVWKYVKIAVVSLVFVLIVGGSTIFYKVKEAQKMAEYMEATIEHGKTGDTYFADENFEGALLEYSEGRNAAKKTKNPVHKNLLGTKLRITQFIIDGDNDVKEGEFEKALTKYEKAEKEAKKLPQFEANAIEEKIASMDKMVQIAEAVKKGDLRFEAEDYAGALEIYKKAQKNAINISYSGMEELKAKIDEATTKIAELEQEQLALNAERLEKKGDQSLAKQDYAGAISSYQEAQAVFQEMNILAKVLMVEKKIMGVEEKLNPSSQFNAGIPSTDMPPTDSAMVNGQLP